MKKVIKKAAIGMVAFFVVAASGPVFALQLQPFPQPELPYPQPELPYPQPELPYPQPQPF